MKLTARDIASIVQGSIDFGSPDSACEAVSIDSRRVQAGDLFFAIRGPHHDGHAFVESALEQGAAGIVASEPISAVTSAFVIRVSDTTRALQDLAHGIRERAGLQVVAVTGSMGKTTTKEAAAAAIGSSHRVLKSQGNWNNLYGLPLSLLALEDEDVAVLEMGMSEPGEVARLTEIARPDVGVLTNIAEVHLEFFPSLEAIAEAKGELLVGLLGDAVAVVNADDPLVLAQARRFAGRKIRYGLGESCDLRGCDISSTPSGLSFVAEYERQRVRVRSPLVGRHNVYNLLAGLAAAHALEVPLPEAAEALSLLGAPSSRGERLSLGGGLVVIDESYNSNPRALRCALEVLSDETAPGCVAVLGDMLELGPRAVELHREAGRDVASRDIRLLVGVGPLGLEIVEGARQAGMPEARLATAADAEAAGRLLVEWVRDGDVILVKASRGIGLERTIRVLRERLAKGGR